MRAYICVCMCEVCPTLSISAAAGQRTLISDSTEENTRFALKTIYYIVSIYVHTIYAFSHLYVRRAVDFCGVNKFCRGRPGRV